MTKCGELAVDCVSNGFTSGKRLPPFYEVLFAKSWKFLNAGKKETMMEKEFFSGKKRIYFPKEFLEKWEGAKQAGDSVPACYFAAYSSEIGKRSIPPNV